MTKVIGLRCVIINCFICFFDINQLWSAESLRKKSRELFSKLYYNLSKQFVNI